MGKVFQEKFFQEKSPEKIVEDIRWAAFNLNMGTARLLRAVGELPADIEAMARATAAFLDEEAKL